MTLRTPDKRLTAFVAGIIAVAGGSQSAMARPAIGGGPVHMARHATAQESTIYNFLGPSTDGGGGDSALVEDAAGNFYGTTFYGGAYSCGSGYPGCGTVFKLSPSPSGGYTESVIWNFQPGQGVQPISVIVDAAGNLYGVTQSTGTGAPGGTVFKLSPGPSGYSYTQLHAFTGGSDGAFPAGGLGFDKSGDLYGTTEFGGTGNCQIFEYPTGCGTAFELKVSGSTYTYSQIHVYQGGTDGAFPTGPVLVQPGGIILVTTAGVIGGTGTDTAGTISQLVLLNGTFYNLTLYAFGYPHRGVVYPMGGVIEDSHQNLFGTATGGGLGRTPAGGVYKLSLVKGIYTQSVLYSFKVSARNGAYPSAGVIEDAAGNLYGTTPIDHNEYFNGGTVFELSPTQNKKYAFSELNAFTSGATGLDPQGVMMGHDGALYGTTFMGGPAYSNSYSGYGVVFRVTL